MVIRDNESVRWWSWPV